jgi:rod shape-determining protein MreC
MESVLGRYRNLIILVGVLFLQVLGLAVQVKRGGHDEENTRLIRIWVVDAVSPFERGLIWIQSSSTNLWHNYFYLRGVRSENRELKQEIEQMRIEQVRLKEDASQAHRLQNLLAFKEQYIAKTVAAQVIGSSGSDLSRVIYIDKGEDAGLKRDMAVITADGIVGKIMLVYPSVAQVLLINDQTSGVGVILEKSRLQGVLRGTANGEVVLERVMSDEQVPVGETVLTSGGDQIFPKGLPVGIVTKVGNGKDLFLNIRVRPAADLSRLEEVLVIVEKQERQALADESVHERAADILAQRLPSVPDKPAPDPTTVPGLQQPATKPAANADVGTKPANAAATPQVAKNSSANVAAHSSPVATSSQAAGTAGSAQNSKAAPAAKSATPTTKSAVGSQSSAAAIKLAETPKTSPGRTVISPPKTDVLAQPRPSVPTAAPVQPSNSQPPADESSPQ